MKVDLKKRLTKIIEEALDEHLTDDEREAFYLESPRTFKIEIGEGSHSVVTLLKKRST